jgi:hypothetical protein
MSFQSIYNNVSSIDNIAECFNKPLTYASNIPFFIVALWGYKYLKGEEKYKALNVLLLIQIFVVGLTSLLYRVIPNPTILFIDVIALYSLLTNMIFGLLYRLKMKVLFYAVLLLITESLGLFLLPTHIFTFATHYLILILFLIQLLVALRKKNKRGFKKSTMIVLTFILALASTKVDLYICNTLGWGTHLLWHLLAATAIFQYIRLIKEIK